MKKCSKCSMSKSALAFRPMARSADGLTAWCIECHKQASQEHYQRNKTERNAAAREWRARNPNKANQASREYHHRNRETRSGQYKEWAKLNGSLRRLTSAKRKAAMLRAIPVWADLAKMKAVYREAGRIQDLTGVRMHVDHIVPLQSVLVCGLHCEANLQIIPAIENESKRNFWWPDMPEQAVAQGQLFAPEREKQVQGALL